jgi:hypothetical protein
MADAEEEGVLVVSELDFFSLSVVEQLLQLLEGLAGDEDALFAADAFECLIGLLDVGEAMAVGGDHGQGLSLDDEERAVEGVAGFLIGDGEDGAGDERLEGDGGDAGGGERGKLRHLGIVGAGHADHLGVGAAGADLHPVVVKQLDGDVAFGQELDVVVELAGGDGAGAWLFDLDGGAGADGLVEVGRGDLQALAIGFDEEVGEDGDGGFALDHALGGGKLSHQFLTADGYLHC